VSPTLQALLCAALVLGVLGLLWLVGICIIHSEGK
jgi:hypothetical protein